MPCYVDDLFRMQARGRQAYRVGARNGHQWCHLLADTPAELHALAAKIGMKRAWHQRDHHTEAGHYDLTPGRREAALAGGAVALDSEAFVAKLRALKAAWRAAGGGS